MVGRRSWEIYMGNGDPSSPVRSPGPSTPARDSAAETIHYSDGSRWPVMVHTVPIRNNSGELQLVLEFASTSPRWNGCARNCRRPRIVSLLWV